MRLGNHHVITVALAALVLSAAAGQETELKTGEVRASHLLGATVKRLTGDSVGEVQDLIVKDADIRLAVISVGGVLGVGGKSVAIPFAEMMVAPDGGTLFLTMSEEQLDAWPAFDLESIHTDLHSAADDPGSPLGETTFEANDFSEPAQPAELAETQHFAEAAPLPEEEQFAPNELGPQAPQLVQPDPLAQSEQLAQAEQLAEEAQSVQTERSVSKSKAANQPASALIGAKVVDPQQSTIGKVNDVVVTAEPPEVQVIVELTEALGGDARFVAVPLPELTIKQEGPDETNRQIESVETSLDVAQLESLPQYQRF
jgi:ribosomal 30S subunit maturation factor RimM